MFFSFAVKFRFVVFRPFVDEILTGRIRSSNHEGVQGTHVVLSNEVVLFK